MYSNVKHTLAQRVVCFSTGSSCPGMVSGPSLQTLLAPGEGAEAEMTKVEVTQPKDKTMYFQENQRQGDHNHAHHLAVLLSSEFHL